jgi:cell division septation protein DedD
MLFDRFSFREREGSLPEEEAVADLPPAGRDFVFTLTTRQLVLLIAGYCFLCVLVFSLGIVVGRAGTPAATPVATDTGLASGPRRQPARADTPAPAGSRLPVLPETPQDQPGREPAFTFAPLAPQSPPAPHSESAPAVMPPPPPAALEMPPSRAPTALAAPPEEKRDAEARRPEATTPRPRESSTPRPVAAGGDYTIQVSSFRSLDQASELKGRLSKKGYAAYVQSVDLNDKGTWHRVRVGSYRDKEGAERVAQDLRSRESLPATVMKR